MGIFKLNYCLIKPCATLSCPFVFSVENEISDTSEDDNDNDDGSMVEQMIDSASHQAQNDVSAESPGGYTEGLGKFITIGSSCLQYLVYTVVTLSIFSSRNQPDEEEDSR